MKNKSVSYAILGHLAFRPWSAYELIQELKRNFHYFYPRAESGLYEELKKLEKLGYTVSSTQLKGKKERSVYTITKAGNVALEEWLHTETDSFKLEFEALMRIFHGKLTNTAVMEKALEKVSNDADVLIKLAEKIGYEYVQGIAPAQSEIVTRAIIFDFLLHFGFLFREWSERTESYYLHCRTLKDESAKKYADQTIRELFNKFNL